MPVSGIEGIGSPITLPTAARVGTGTGDDTSFAQSITGAVDELRGLQSQSNELAVAAVTGDLDDIHSAMIASTRASVTLELISAVRNKGVDAFNEIMRMQA
ncbi:flagellar hook-basal body complex protein FliE [Microbacterium sp. RU33B]|uniref:flagellar hook-basal body complex protein FliE n=1 Tax=Microbacterium sp. RU33B TaxID=1907390 RepID=UPI000962A4A3|nr:flagellar hook-basal body complex protein FliE [Microbacterium sp. RU33B]SIT83249.1 flagellar hook-basal body complex protein FliE [Microbacterium sp. RU33B]